MSINIFFLKSSRIDCQRRGRIDVELLSAIFTERVIRKCFDISMRTVNRKGKQIACDFVNLICGVDVGDVSSVDGQCECLVGAITV